MVALVFATVLSLPPVADTVRVGHLIDTLGHANGDARDRAEAELAKMGKEVRPHLARAFDRANDTEPYRRLGRLLLAIGAEDVVRARIRKVAEALVATLAAKPLGENALRRNLEELRLAVGLGKTGTNMLSEELTRAQPVPDKNVRALLEYLKQLREIQP